MWFAQEAPSQKLSTVWIQQIERHGPRRRNVNWVYSSDNLSSLVVDGTRLHANLPPISDGKSKIVSSSEFWATDSTLSRLIEISPSPRVMPWRSVTILDPVPEKSRQLCKEWDTSLQIRLLCVGFDAAETLNFLPSTSIPDLDWCAARSGNPGRAWNSWSSPDGAASAAPPEGRTVGIVHFFSLARLAQLCSSLVEEGHRSWYL